MTRSRIGYYVEAALWLVTVAFLYYKSFEFTQEIEIYRYGAASWPRAILLLMAIAAIGQLIYNLTREGKVESGMIQAAMDDGAEDNARDSDNSGLRWYLSTIVLIAIPFLYINLPKLLAGTNDVSDPGLHRYKLICAAVLSLFFIAVAWRNHVGAVLALPVLFAAMLQDIGFYALTPVFMFGIMFLMGERRYHWMLAVICVLYFLLMMLFVKILYVGLPTGYVRPFYDFGTWVVTLLQ